jgi:CO dehydrogenase/acetyl-CoA synthase alpha subunit
METFGKRYGKTTNEGYRFGKTKQWLLLLRNTKTIYNTQTKSDTHKLQWRLQDIVKGDAKKIEIAATDASNTEYDVQCAQLSAHKIMIRLNRTLKKKLLKLYNGQTWYKYYTTIETLQVLDKLLI